MQLPTIATIVLTIMLSLMGVGTSRTLGVQGAGILGVILPHRDGETQLCFFFAENAVWQEGAVAYVMPTTLPLPPISCKTVIAA